MFSPAFFNLEISQSMYVHGRNLKNDELKIHHLPLICQKTLIAAVYLNHLIYKVSH